MRTAGGRIVVLVACVWAFGAGLARAADAAGTKGSDAGDAKLRARVDKLEEQVGTLMKVVQSQAVQLDQAKQANEKLQGQLGKIELNKAGKAMAANAKGRTDNRHNLWANLDVQLYGKIKADAAFDSSRTNAGNFARWVESDGPRGTDHQFNTTANETRLGLKITGPDVGGAATSGLVEMDLYGGGAENKPNPMLRHAFLKIDWPKENFSLIAGQTWDVISPLNPSVLNYSVQWWVGNIGYRRPQIRLTKRYPVAKDTELKLEGALARTIGHDGPFDPGDTGEDAGYPGVQGRASLAFPLWGGRKTVVGASAHYAQEEYDTDATGRSVEVHSWSANVDLAMPVNAWLTLKGEAFTGQDIDAYLGGIGQGIDVAGLSVTELRSAGGWCAASLGPWDRWRFNIGVAGEFLCSEADAAADGTRTCNSAVFGNAIYEINPNTSVGVEVSRWLTEYKGLPAGDSIRVQTSFIYSF